MRRATAAARPGAGTRPARRPHRGHRAGGLLPGARRRRRRVGVAGDEVVSHLVHQETTFDRDACAATSRCWSSRPTGSSSRTPTTTPDDPPRAQPHVATATTEAVPLTRGSRRHADPRGGRPRRPTRRARRPRDHPDPGLGRGEPPRPDPGRLRGPGLRRRPRLRGHRSPPTTSRCGSAPAADGEDALSGARGLRAGAVRGHRRRLTSRRL